MVNTLPELVALDRGYGDITLVIHHRYVESYEAKLVAQFLERWGMVAAKDGGEDSKGRHKLALCSPEEVVDRACSVAELAVKALSERGWLGDIKPYDKLVSEARKRRKSDPDSN